MQFVNNGPDIPNELLQEHEQGRVVFFCGAGISYPAGLPNFEGLVKKIYQVVGTAFSPLERDAFNRGQFDATLDLLEHRLRGQRLELRRALVEALKPKLRRRGAADTQTALLRLARSREGSLRLVTTNFDPMFQIAAKRSGQSFQAYAAPSLPIPKNSRWNGLVYLHGLLPKKADDTALNHLVVTSGDFGLAYLTERWAARFVSELFRNYVVCFVGYSISDPVLRYMMDALAADHMLGEVMPKAWALGSCEAGNKEQIIIEWNAKGVTPILYNVPTGSHDHSALHLTLQAWAETYRDGVQGKEAIVVRHALARPQESTQQDDFVGRMIWALSDKSGLPAARFADFNPAPSLDWLLGAFTDERFRHCDLLRFGVPPHDNVDAKLRFSLTKRPAPYDRAPLMLLVSSGNDETRWDEVMSHMARWLVRHLNDPNLIIWIAQHGGQLHDNWRRLIEDKLNDFLTMERDGKIAELNAIRLQAPNAVPVPLMRTLWRLLLSKRVKSPNRDFAFYRWQGRLKKERLTTTLRLELRDMLAPKVVLKKPFFWTEEQANAAEAVRLRQMIDWELVLSENNVHYSLRDLRGEHWISALPDLVEDFQHLLRDALDILRELGDADDYDYPSHWHLPSIEPHPQNRGFHDWVSLIELLRDAWLTVFDVDRSRATRIAQTWFELPYATFKRLALFAASKDGCILPKQWADWLVADSRWLWSLETGREVLRLITLRGRYLTEIDQHRLETAILAGPPRVTELTPNQQDDLVTHLIWLRLSKLRASGLTLGESAAARLMAISVCHPKWRLEPNEREEFSIWTSGTSDPDFEESRTIDYAPKKRHELVTWLVKPPAGEPPFHQDTWRDVCRTHLLNSLYALYDLAKLGVWPANRWREALQVWAEERLVMRTWRYAAPIVKFLPDAELQEIAHAVTWWMEAASKAIDCHEDVLLELCGRMLALPLNESTRVTRGGEPVVQPVLQAINHPVGHATQALINLWFRRKPNDNDLLPSEIAPFLTSICDVQVDRFRHGRVLLGSRLVALFRVDRLWTEQHLLPLLAWDNPIEARAVWGGFLWSPRLYQPLLTAFKKQFLETARHYAELCEYREQFAAFLTYTALGPYQDYSVEELRSAMEALPQEGLEQAAETLAQALEGAADQREHYWTNRVQPLWRQVWPKSGHSATPQIAVSLTRLAIAAGGEFPAALSAIQHWLQPIEYSGYIISLLHESGLCMRFPEGALRLLNTVIADRDWAPQELAQCLDAIVEVKPNLAQDTRTLRLRQHIRRRGL